MAGPVLAALEKPGPLFAVFSFALPTLETIRQFHFICGSYTCDNSSSSSVKNLDFRAKNSVWTTSHANV